MPFDQLLSTAESVADQIAAGAIIPDVTAGEIRRHLEARYNFCNAVPLDALTADVEWMLRHWQVQVTHPRYLGLFNPSVTPASVVADAIVAMYNPQLATWRTSPAANEIERHTLGWLKSNFGFPASAAANFTSGGAEANLSATIAALTRSFPDYADGGLRMVPGTPTVYLTDQAHHSFTKIAHLTGIGRAALRRVRTTADFKMDVSALAEQVVDDRRRGDLPFMVVGTAGTTAAGAIDPLPRLAEFCRQENLWLHVDAAWGGAAIVSPRLRHHLEGIDAADSITCDAHKWFSVSMAAGMFFCRHPDVVREAFRVETTYMPPKADATEDPFTSSIQWSRRFTGLKLFMSLAERGESGYAAMIEHQARMGDLLRDALRHAGWRIVNATPLPLVCFTRENLDVKSLLTSLYERQIAWISEVRLEPGEAVLRACITSFRTRAEDIDVIVREMGTLL
jgi:glutamate/tyrosine decarboxylase-like PLP-dependent enzyme